MKNSQKYIANSIFELIIKDKKPDTPTIFMLYYFRGGHCAQFTFKR